MRSLTKHGFQVETAADGVRGLELARQLHPDVITLDVLMPGMDGWAVLSALKANLETANIPVVVVTIIDDKNIGFALGADDYLTKPIDWPRLITVLEKYRDRSTSNTVLVVEDDASQREMLRRALENEGWNVVEAANGRIALDCARQQVPGVILSDLMMPEMDGFEFITELRAHTEFARVPVIVVTAKDVTQEERQYLNGKVETVLLKSSVSLEELVLEIRKRAIRGQALEMIT